MRYHLLAALTLALLVTAAGTACSGAGDSTAAPTRDLPRPLTPPLRTPAPTDIALPPGAEPLVTRARQDLAQRLDLPPDAIQLVSVEGVDWPDAGLGCPQPGTQYAQVITPGFILLLEAEGRTVEYHTDRGQRVVLCEEETMMDVPTVPGTVEPGLEHLIDLAKEDLAQRLSISVDQIDVLEARSVVWSDAGLGCPQAGMRYKQVPQDGALIRLGVGDRVYPYHSGGGREPFPCEPTAKGDEVIPPPGSEDL